MTELTVAITLYGGCALGALLAALLILTEQIDFSED